MTSLSVQPLSIIDYCCNNVFKIKEQDFEARFVLFCSVLKFCLLCGAVLFLAEFIYLHVRPSVL